MPFSNHPPPIDGPLARLFAGRRSTRWLLLAVILLPLGGLLALQFWWLTDLERSAELARRAALEEYLNFVDEQVEFFYSSNAERTLDVAPEIVLGPRQHWRDFLEKRFSKKVPKGFRMAFLVGFPEGSQWERMVFWDFDKRQTAAEGPLSAYAASLYWEMLARRNESVEVTDLAVDERDPGNPVILRPILEEGRLIGVAGAIVKVDYFHEELLPKLVAKVTVSKDRNLLASLRSPSGRELLAGAAAPELDFAVARNFSFIFTNWTLSMQSGPWSTAHLVRWNILLNAGISLGLAVALIGGIGLVLRTASREMHLSKMKADFVSNVSHELRTPLSSIRVFGELMRQGSVREEDKVREYGTYIESESRRLSQLIKNILDFSRIESGEQVYRFAPTRLEEVVASVLRTFEVRLRNTDFELTFQPSDRELPEMPVDADALAHAIGNLLDNAVKYSNGSRTVEVALSRDEDEACISVADHGVGISPQEQRRIFERFHRVSTGLVHEVRGSGLGLAIVQHIVAAHDGRVTVESRPGRGSRFSIFLPLRTPAPTRAPSALKRTAEAEGS